MRSRFYVTQTNRMGRWALSGWSSRRGRQRKDTEGGNTRAITRAGIQPPRHERRTYSGDDLRVRSTAGAGRLSGLAGA